MVTATGCRHEQPKQIKTATAANPRQLGKTKLFSKLIVQTLAHIKINAVLCRANLKTLHAMNTHTTYTVLGTYGSHNTPCKVFICADGWHAPYYAVEGSVNVNAAHIAVDLYTDDGEVLNVETLADVDAFTAAAPINSEEDLLKAVLS